MIEETEFDFSDRIMSTEVSGEDSDVEVSLRPKCFDDYIGQDKVKENLKVYIDAAKLRGESLDHVLLCGNGVGVSIGGIFAHFCNDLVSLSLHSHSDKIFGSADKSKWGDDLYNVAWVFNFALIEYAEHNADVGGH